MDCRINDKADLIVNLLKSIMPKKKIVPLHEPCFNGNEQKYLNDCIETGWVSSVGSYVDRFEKGIADYIDSPYVISTVNGTSALHLALKTLGVEKNDEVLIPSMTFIATANAVSYCNAYPHFVDVEDRSFGIDANKLEDYLNTVITIKNGQSINKYNNRKISAIIVMHCFGMPALGIEKLKYLSKKFKLFLVEDAAESLGSFYNNKHTGIFSDIGIFSFNGNKIITTGGGGALVTNNKNLSIKARHLATTGKLKNNLKSCHDIIAYNYRMPNINAALGLAQLEQIDDFIRKKRKLAKKYQDLYLNTEVSLLSESENTKSNYWLNSLIFNDKNLVNAVLEKLISEKIMARLVWQPLHQSLPYSKCSKMNLEVTERLSNQVLNVPSSANLI